MKSIIGILGAFMMAIGGAILFDFLYELTTTYFQRFIPSPDLPVELMGFMSFLFLSLDLLLIIQSVRKN